MSEQKKKKKQGWKDSPVIDWEEAMQQCGDDEEFLLELLEDLREETDQQVTRMEESIKDKDESFVPIVRAAHVIKGAASNLMCEQLRFTAMLLENGSQEAVNKGGDKKDKALLESVQKKLNGLKEAVANYHEKLEEIL